MLFYNGLESSGGNHSLEVIKTMTEHTLVKLLPALASMLDHEPSETNFDIGSLLESFGYQLLRGSEGFVRLESIICEQNQSYSTPSKTPWISGQ